MYTSIVKWSGPVGHTLVCSREIFPYTHKATRKDLDL